MIVPSIYSQNETQIGTALLPLQRRKPKFIAWVVSFLNPVNWLNTYFQKYYGGSNAATWVSGTTYSYGDQVVYFDNKVYEMQNLSGLTSTVAPPLDTTNWYQVLDTFVGVGERVRYTGQLVVLEYLINKYFSIIAPAITPSLPFTGASHTTQIYIVNNGYSAYSFYLGLGASPFQSYMGNGSSAFQHYLGNSYSINSFTVYVPVAVDAAITAKQASGITAEDIVRSVIDKYVQAGKKYNYLTY